MKILCAELGLAEAIAHREVGEHARALDELEILAAGGAEVTLFCTVRAGLELVQAHLDAGELTTASEVFLRTQALVDSESFGANGRDWLARVGTVLTLSCGDGAVARRFAEQIEDPFWAAISIARVQLFDGARVEAAETLHGAIPRVVGHEVVLGLLSARAATQHDDAMKAAGIAVERASAVGIVQTVASEGPEVVDFVERAAWRAPASWLSKVRLAATAAVPRLDNLRLVEPLTERERDVLRFLSGRLTIHEIADELFVSMNTLKFHLKVIYRKLGVSSRAEAAEVARRLLYPTRQAP